MRVKVNNVNYEILRDITLDNNDEWGLICYYEKKNTFA